MEAGTGQRRAAGGQAPPDPRRAPAVVAHTPRQACTAIKSAGPRGVLLLSAPGAAGGVGAAWFLACVAEARNRLGGADAPPNWAVLDCADAPGFALHALRAGARLLVLHRAVPAFGAVAAAAEEIGAAVWGERPPALDLGALDLRPAGRGRRRLSEWLTSHAVTGPPPLG